MHGFKLTYQHNRGFNRWINMLGSLALVRLCDFDESLRIVMSDTPQDVNCSPIIDYFEKQWLNGSWPKTIWNHGDTHDPTTNNFVEGYNKQINNFLNHAHPNIWRFADFIKSEESRIAIDMTRADFNPLDRFRKRKHQRDKEEQATALRSAYHEGSISLKQYLVSLSTKIELPLAEPE